MDYRPVGIFDSGMGGLTAVRVLRELLPGEDIAYLGDTARVPYGGRSVAELIEIARSDARFLRARAIKAMLVACGTSFATWRTNTFTATNTASARSRRRRTGC